METYILYYIASMLISYFVSSLLAPKPQQPKAAAFDDFDFPQVEEGTPQAVVFGDCWSEDWTIIGLGNYRTEEIPAED